MSNLNFCQSSGFNLRKYKEVYENSQLNNDKLYSDALELVKKPGKTSACLL